MMRNNFIVYGQKLALCPLISGHEALHAKKQPPLNITQSPLEYSQHNMFCGIIAFKNY